jgi:hypothetical protein
MMTEDELNDEQLALRDFMISLGKQGMALRKRIAKQAGVHVDDVAVMYAIRRSEDGASGISASLDADQMPFLFDCLYRTFLSAVERASCGDDDCEHEKDEVH